MVEREELKVNFIPSTGIVANPVDKRLYIGKLKEHVAIMGLRISLVR